MSYKVVLIPEAEKDYKRLDGSIKKLVNKKIEELLIPALFPESFPQSFLQKMS